MNIYLELWEKAHRINDLLRRDKAFFRDKFDGTIMDTNGRIWHEIKDISGSLGGLQNKFLQLTSELIKEASTDTGFAQIRTLNDGAGEHERLTVSIRGGFPPTPDNTVPPEEAMRIMYRRSGVDITVAPDRLFVESVTGSTGSKHDPTTNLIGDISWKTKPVSIVPEGESLENYIKQIEDGLDELGKLNIAQALLSLVENQVTEVVNS